MNVRATFTRTQTEELKKVFLVTMSPPKVELISLAERFVLTKRQGVEVVQKPAGQTSTKARLNKLLRTEM